MNTTMELEKNFWHCRMILKNERMCSSYNKSYEDICKQIVIPYNSRSTIFIDSLIVSDIDDIYRISILKSKVSTSSYRNNMTVPLWAFLEMHSENVTYKLLSGNKKLLNNENGDYEIPEKHVFIVHGHDESTKSQLARMLHTQGVEFTILDEKPSKGKTIIEKFEHHANKSSFAITLWTADDFGHKLGSSQPNNRARQNVIFEAGFFCGKLGRENVVVLLGESVEIPSDLHGVNYISLGKDDWPFQLLREMKAAGFEVDSNKLI